jgi:hypothetical protein
LVDSGGSNGWRSRGWKYHLQYDLCDPFGLTVTICRAVCHDILHFLARVLATSLMRPPTPAHSAARTHDFGVILPF